MLSAALACAWALALGLGTAPARADGGSRDHAPATASGSSSGARGCLPTHDGYLRARVRGARSLDLDWRDAELQCDGGPRPGRGFRLMFAARAGAARAPLRLVFGIDAPARAGKSHEVPVNVTLIFEGDHRIYSTAGEAQCTLDRLSVTSAQRTVAQRRAEVLQGALAPRRSEAPQRAEAPHLLRVSARGFCVGPASAIGAPATGGEDQLVMSRFDFAGALHTDAP